MDRVCNSPFSFPPSLFPLLPLLTLPPSLPFFQFSPTAGPIAGGTHVIVEGTNLGVTPSHIERVWINGVVSDVLDELYKPGVRY